MKPFLCTLLLFAATSAELYWYGPRHPLPGREWDPGSVWPLPQQWTPTPNLFTFNPGSFEIVVEGVESCSPLDFARVKYGNEFLFDPVTDVSVTPDPAYPVLNSLTVRLGSSDECESYPQLSSQPDVDEHYTLNFDEETRTAEIFAESVWGALRGIETFSQLIWTNDNYINGPLHFYINQTFVEDAPRYSHRGLMIDTARHYLPEKVIMEVLDAMMYNKFNVLHWHITDDQSFPFVSQRFPELHQQGAFTPAHIYTPEAVQRVIEAGRVHGIRVILEFDTPGHTYSFGHSHPELLTPCYGEEGEPGTPDYPNHAAFENFDPTKETTYTFMRDFFSEILSNVTKDEYVHLGMDEVYPPCWESSPEIAEFMAQNGYTMISEVQKHYIDRHVEMVKSLGGKPISWQDPLDLDIDMDSDILVHVWKNWDIDWIDQLQRVLDKGYKVIVSGPWYINYINYGESWREYYLSDPVLSLPDITEEQQQLIVGGEVCIWGEFVDKNNILPRLFPFSSAIAERLWSQNIGISEQDANDARKRLHQHRCRMLRRGVPAQPILNGYCGAWEV